MEDNTKTEKNDNNSNNENQSVVEPGSNIEEVKTSTKTVAEKEESSNPDSDNNAENTDVVADTNQSTANEDSTKSDSSGSSGSSESGNNKPPFRTGEARQTERKQAGLESWKPRTALGSKVKNKEITSIDQILESGQSILEPEIVDLLLPNLEIDFAMVGQSKGKFGGGRRRIFKQTQKKTNEGNKPSFSSVVIVGNKKGFVGVGFGKGRETVPAREKALRHAKLNIMKVPLGSGSWEGNPEDINSIPFKVSGKTGSVKITLIPAPKGTGLQAPSECRRILSLIGIQDIWTKTLGQTGTVSNLIRATIKALEQLNQMTIPTTVKAKTEVRKK